MCVGREKGGYFISKQTMTNQPLGYDLACSARSCGKPSHEHHTIVRKVHRSFNIHCWLLSANIYSSFITGINGSHVDIAQSCASQCFDYNLDDTLDSRYQRHSNNDIS